MAPATVADLLRRHTAARPRHPALTADEVTWSFTELDQRANRCANALAGDGVGAQDRVAFFGKNAPEFFEVLFGAAKLNAVTVAVNWRLAAPEVAFILDDAQATVLVVASELLPVLDSVRSDLTSLKRVVVVDTSGGRDEFGDWAAAGGDADPTVDASPDDVALQLYTSGTTGRPKGAMLTHQNLAAMLPVTSQQWHFDGDSVNLVAMPLFHVGGVGWALVGMFVGAHSVLLREVDPAEVLRVIPRHGITHALFVPAVLQVLLATPGIEETDFSSLQFVIYGASPISVDVLSRSLDRFGCGFIQGYGLTETTGAVVQLLPEDHDPTGPNVHRLRAAGKPMPGAEVRIVDPRTADDCGPGHVGEILLRSPQIMQAYWNRPAETLASIDAGGWFHTGDAGYVDQDGYLFINDRVKDMIISGGENIYPGEIENVLMSHPAVVDVAVIGVPSERWGETPKALVVTTPAATVPPDELIGYCRGRLAGYKIPTSLDFVDELPRNAAGKVLKRELRAPYWQHHDRGVH